MRKNQKCIYACYGIQTDSKVKSSKIEAADRLKYTTLKIILLFSRLSVR